MPLFGRAIEDITEQHLQSLIDDEVTEGKSIDYKLELNLEKGDDKKEFLADVTSFANTAGGHLLIGIKPDGDRAVELRGMAATPEEQDRIKQQIENLLRDSIDPRLPPLQQRFVSLGSGNHILVLRIGQSWAGPHMVKTSSKFFARNSAGKFHLDTQQLRAAFAASDDLGRRMGAWKTERIGKIMANEAPWPLPPGAKIIAHLLPQQAFVPGAAVDVLSLKNLRPMGASRLGGHNGTRPNLDGVSTSANARDQKTCMTYLQVFRSGCVEAVDAWMLPPDEHTPGKDRIPSSAVENELIQFVAEALPHLKSLGIDGPTFACFSLVGVRGYRLAVSEQLRHWDAGAKLRPESLHLPEVLLDIRSTQDAATILRPAFDVMWNAFGWERSMNYDEDGRRIRT